MCARFLTGSIVSKSCSKYVLSPAWHCQIQLSVPSPTSLFPPIFLPALLWSMTYDLSPSIRCLFSLLCTELYPAVLELMEKVTGLLAHQFWSPTSQVAESGVCLAKWMSCSRLLSVLSVDLSLTHWGSCCMFAHAGSYQEDIKHVHAQISTQPSRLIYVANGTWRKLQSLVACLLPVFNAQNGVQP